MPSSVARRSSRGDNPSLDRDLAHLRGQLIQNPRTGAPLAHDCFEIRLKIGSKGKGKSGGARVITAVVYAAEKVYLLDIYDKGDRATVTDKQAAY